MKVASVNQHVVIYRSGGPGITITQIENKKYLMRSINA